MRCQAITQSGKRCRRKALPGSRFCAIHQDQAMGAGGGAPKPKKPKGSAKWHFRALGGPGNLRVVEYGLADCADEELVNAILATPYFQLISCHPKADRLTALMARPCAAKHHEQFNMLFVVLASRLPEKEFDAGIIVGNQPPEIVKAMKRIVRGPIIKVG